MTETQSPLLQDVLWVEKYRPKALDQMALADDTRAVLSAYLAAGEIPHLLFVGPAGSGKTTAAQILYRALDAQVLILNASAERGIDVVRDKIGAFVTGLGTSRWNIVFLDEADAMTPDAQTALRNLIETYADQSRFILTANYGHRIIGPIQSRCQLLAFERPPLKERYRILSTVLAAELISAPPAVMLSYVERYPDLRQMLMSAQRAYLAAPEQHSDDCAAGLGMACDCPGRTLPPVAAVSAADGATMFAALEAKNWRALRAVVTAGDFFAQQSLRELFYAIPDEHPKAGRLRHIVGRGVHETGFSPDPTVLFLAVVAEAMEAL